MATIGSQIRSYFHTAILAATGLPETSVLKSPRFHLDADNLPFISVYSHGDRPLEADQISDRRHSRVYTVAVEINAAGRVEEDTTDDLAVQVRQAILSDGTLGRIVNFTVWSSQEWGAKDNATAESATLLLFSCHYLWTPGA